jgi:hypothetical protein
MLWRGLAAALLLAFLAPSAALAHERRDVAGGKLQFVVGFVDEPAILGEPNGIDLRVTNKANNEPVDGLEKVFKATIQFGGGQPKELPLRARFGMKGAYTADLIPTRAGDYIFTFTGTYEGVQVDERFESGPGRFNPVEDAAKLHFPQAVPPATELQAQLEAARTSADQARTFGMAGAALGVLGLALGGLALLRRPKAA